MPSARIKAYLALAGAALIWGAAQPLIKPALHHIAPIQYMFLRYSVALPMGIVALFFIFKKYRPDIKTLLKILLIEGISLSNLLLLYTGLQYTTALQSALLLNLRPIFVTFLGIIILKEHEEKNEWIGLLLSVVGTAMVIIGPYLSNTPSTQSSTLGNTLIVITNVIATSNTIFAKKTYKKVPKMFVTATNAINGFLYFGFFNLLLFGNLPIQAMSNFNVALPVLYMGIFGTFIAMSLSIYGYDRIEASEAALFSYLEPLVYIPLTVFWLKESVSLMQIAGMAVIVVGVLWATKRITTKKQPLKHGIPLLDRLRIHEAPAKLPLHHRR